MRGSKNNLHNAFPPFIPSTVAPAPQGNKSIRTNSSPKTHNVQISTPKLKVALALAGVHLTSEELQVLQDGFRSDRSKDMVRTREGACFGCLLSVEEISDRMEWGTHLNCSDQRAMRMSCCPSPRTASGAGVITSLFLVLRKNLVLHESRDACERLRYRVDVGVWLRPFGERYSRLVVHRTVSTHCCGTRDWG